MQPHATTKVAAVAQRFFSVASAATYTDLSQDSIRELLRRGDLTDHRPLRGKILIDRAQLDQLVLGSLARPTRGRGIRRGPLHVEGNGE